MSKILGIPPQQDFLLTKAGFEVKGDHYLCCYYLHSNAS